MPSMNSECTGQDCFHVFWGQTRGRQDHLFFDLKSNQSLDLFFIDLRFKINLLKN
jgi:hypothetical protein